MRWLQHRYPSHPHTGHRFPAGRVQILGSTAALQSRTSEYLRGTGGHYMTLDTSPLRVALALVDLTLLLLFYFITFRRTRSAYSGSWCLALLFFLAGIRHSCWTVRRTRSGPTRWGTCCSWPARPASGRVPVRCGPPALPVWYLAAGPAIMAVASALDQPGHQCLVRRPGLSRVHGPADWPRLPGTVPARPALFPRAPPLAVGAGFLAPFYLGRLVAFLSGRYGPVPSLRRSSGPSRRRSLRL